MTAEADFYKKLRSTATRLFLQRGQVCTLRHSNGAAVNDDTGEATQTETTAIVAGILTTYSDKQTGRAIADRAAGTSFDERRLSISAETVNAATRVASGILTFEPKDGDRVTTADGVLWHVTECKPTNPAGVAVSYELRVKRG